MKHVERVEENTPKNDYKLRLRKKKKFLTQNDELAQIIFNGNEIYQWT
jgi:translation initiation factor IF-3